MSERVNAFYHDLFESEFFMFDDDEPYFQEQILQIIWNEQNLSAEKMTACGKKIEIIHPGTWNVEPGPDFHHAVIAFDGDVRQGDVEIHMKPEDWYRHNHHRNDDYEGVILHAVWMDSGNTRQDPISAPLFEIRKHLNGSLQDILLKVNELFYPYSRKVAPGKYAESFASLSDPKLKVLFQSYGIARILQKAQFFALDIETYGIEPVAYKGFMDGLGYKSNRAAFAQLVQELPLAELSVYNKTDALAILFGASGLLPDPTRQFVLPEYRPWVEEMWRFWWPRRKAYKEIPWQRKRNRPFNRPERRLLSAYFIMEKNSFLLGKQIIDTMSASAEPRDVMTRLVDLFAVRSTSEFEQFYSFSRKLKKPAALLGRSRILDLIINVAVPLYFSHCFLRNEVRLCERGKEILLAAPKLQDNRILKEAAHYFFVPPSRFRDIITNACAQQGLIQVYRELSV